MRSGLDRILGLPSRFGIERPQRAPNAPACNDSRSLKIRVDRSDFKLRIGGKRFRRFRPARPAISSERGHVPLLPPPETK